MGAASRRDYVQDERYIAIEHMDVRRDCVSFARGLINRGETPLPHMDVRRDCVSFARGLINRGETPLPHLDVRRDCVSFARG